MMYKPELTRTFLGDQNVLAIIQDKVWVLMRMDLVLGQLQLPDQSWLEQLMAERMPRTDYKFDC